MERRGVPGLEKRLELALTQLLRCDPLSRGRVAVGLKKRLDRNP